MKTNLILILASILLLGACTKQISDENAKKIPTIALKKQNAPINSIVSNYEPGPKYKIVPGFREQIGVNQWLCYPTTDICYFSGPIYYRTNSAEEEGFDVTFYNLNGKLKGVFEKSSISTSELEKYFYKGEYHLSNTQYLAEDINNELKFESPVLLKQGNYQIFDENSETFSIQF